MRRPAGLTDADIPAVIRLRNVKINSDGTKVYVAVHVDDFGIAASNKTLMAETKSQMCLEGDLDFNLGMKVVRDRVKRTITISQPGYLEDVRAEYGITPTKGPLTPMVDKPREPESVTNPRLDAVDTQPYQSKVGSLLWPAIGTRPELLFTTNAHSRYTKSP